MRVGEVTAWRDGEETVLAARVEPARGPSFPLWFRIRGLEAAPLPRGDAFAAALLPTCMYDGEALSVEAPVSPRLLGNLPLAQEVLADWHGELRPVAVAAPPGGLAEPEGVAAGVACCFTSGVDSWYSLQRNVAGVTHLLLVRGFDMALGDRASWRGAVGRVGRVARRLGKRLVTVATNLREVADRGRYGRRRYAGDFWGGILHGAALAAVGHALQREIGTLIVPATHSYRQLRPWGTSPLLDPLWSTDWLQLVHDGCGASRFEKVADLRDAPLALETLRVCYQPQQESNCCRCEKCMRTMLELRLCGALGRASAFPLPLDLKRMRRQDVPRRLIHPYRDMLPAALASGDRAALETLRVLLGERVAADRAAALAWRRLRYARRSLGRRLAGRAAAGGSA